MWGRVRDHLHGLHERCRGFRTIGVCVLFGIVGLLNTLGAIDMQPLVSFFVPNERAAGAVMVVLAIVFGICRWATTTAMFISRMQRPPEA